MPRRWRAARCSSRLTPAASVLLLFLLLVVVLPVGRCQVDGNIGGTPPAVYPLFTQYANDLLANLTRSMEPQMEEHFGFCIRDPNQDWNRAFNFSTDMTFLTKCLISTADLPQRICTAAEVKLYFNSFLASGGVKPNKNCNLNTWTAGCEPGWACAVSQNETVNFEDSENIPSRAEFCKPICEGFFSPYGITCMISCPLGAYCPRSTLNEDTGLCEPYNYQPSPGRMNHTCGGADIWADVQSSSDIFCPEGYYCPSTIQKFPCRSGYYCRKGSTYETRCFKSSSCKPNSTNQDIKLFGGLVMVALSLLLLIIYNFYDQIITFRERRQAKSREAAARTARQAVQARERWKAAKSAAIKHASGLQQQLSHTFSRKKINKQTELAKVHSQSNSKYSSEESVTEIDEQSILSNMDNPFEDISDMHVDHHANVGDKTSKKNMPKSKYIHTHSQIFKYAYGQIEKEKVMQEENKNLTFSGVINLATKREIRTRPLIEVDFKDLTLSLKRNKKTLLKCVTGKLKPGHITAVMGPSGAGKTTFLTALAGKTAGCEVTGLVLINGKVEPIRSYKKIIGFVPQDDVVHGNLTVEENLWFSARCRLSADMAKADLVLVVERAIESLGLQAVRNSLVGTVEKRGISGGQRKRVNVGLEMVMEPSLLILDEPTSGLDSSSSQLLLRALRREALEGVNICMVVHQPSYTLFNMFDDLILLAKGGFIAYQGPVKQVEEYFAGLAIYVPDRVNPPDYFIDILEGIVKPSSNISVKRDHLPLIWMLHNGYNIPPDMQHDLDAVDASVRELATTSAKSEVNHHSASNEVWENFKDAFEEKQHCFNFSKSKDLTNRRTPGIITQYKLYLGRVGKQRLREARVQVVDLLMLCLAGVCLGLLAKINDETLGVVGYSYTIIAVSLLCKIGALRSFSLEKLQYMRERASGMSSLAYFLSKDTIDHFNTILKPIFYLSMFYFLNNPRSSFPDNYIILLALVYCVTGIGYTFAICFQPGSAQLWAALLPVVLTLVSSRPGVPLILRNLCYPKWALEAFVVANAGRYRGVWLITRCGALMKAGFDINHLILCIGVLFLYGFVFRCIAFICLVMLQKR